MAAPDESSILLKLGVDLSAVKRLPNDMQQALSRLQQVFGESATPGAGKFQQGVGTLLSKGPSGRDISEMRRNFRAANRALEEFYSEEAKIIERNAVDNANKARKANAAKFGSESDLREELKYIKQGRNMALKFVQDERRRMARDLQTLGDVGPAGPPQHQGGGGRGGFFRGMFGGGAGGGGGVFGPGRGGMMGGILRHIGIPMGMAGLTFAAVDQLRRAVGVDTERFDLGRRIGTSGEMSGWGSGGREAFADRMRIPMLSPTESLSAQGAFASLAGAGRADMGRTAALAGIGLGIGHQGGADFFGTMSKMGVAKNDPETKRLAILIGETIANTQMRGREGEMLSAMTEFAQMGLRTMVNGPGGQDMANLMMRLASTGDAGTKGALGMRILGGAHSAMAGTELFPGMGQGLLGPLMMQTIMESGVTDISEMQKIAQQGIFGKAGGRSVLEGVLGKVSGMGLPDVMGANMMGLPVEMFQKLKTLQGGGGFTEFGEHKEALMGSMQRLGPAVAALSELRSGAISREEYDARIGKILEEPAGPEERQKAMADLADKLNQAFTRLIPIVDKAAKAFNDLLDSSFMKWLTGENKKTAAEVVADTVPGARSGLSMIKSAGDKVRSFLGGNPSRGQNAFSRVPKDVQDAIQATAAKTGVDKDYLASIWIAEGGDKASLGGAAAPFGIADSVAKGFNMGTDLQSKTDIAGNTVKNKMLMFQRETGRSPVDPETGRYTDEFTRFLGSKYAPLDDARDTKGLNKNWPGNVAREYAGAGGKVTVEFEPATVVTKNEQGEVTGSAVLVPSASTRSQVAE